MERTTVSDVTFGNVKQGKLAEVVAAHIRNEIRTGALDIGDRLPPERELIAQLGVSRATVREALTLLESDGFVSVRAGRNGGAYVTRPRIERLATILDVILAVENTTTEELLEARAMMEPLAVRLASERADEDDLRRIEESVQRMADNPDDATIVAEEAARFHVLIADATHNGVIAALTATTQQLIFSRVFEALGTHADDTVRAHRRIFEAIRKRDPELAVKRMLRHVGAFETVLSQEPGDLPR